MDKAWRLTHLYKIKDKQGKLVTFQPNPIQLKHIAESWDLGYRYVLMLKARQFGFTTLYCIDCLDDALWVDGMTCGIIAHEAKKLPDYFTIVKRAYDNMPEYLKPETKTDTKYMYEFVKRFDGKPMDSSIYVSVDIRGGTVQRLHITESAYIRDRQALNAGSKQAVPITGRISEETTGNGFNEFYDFYTECQNNPNPKENDYRTFFYPWFLNPEYTLPGQLEDKTEKEIEIQQLYNLTDGQLVWRRWKVKELTNERGGIGLSGEQLFKQEYPATVTEAFQSGAGNIFDAEKIDKVKIKIPLSTSSKPEVQALIDKGFRIWVEPQHNGEYVTGCDPSDGEGSDFSCIDIWDKNTLEQVAQFYGKVRPDELAEINKMAAEVYNNAFVGVESNMLTTILILSKIYDNYYFQTIVDERTASRTKKIGWHTNTKTRDVMIDDFIIAFEEDGLIINSLITLREMKTFVRNPDNGKREHAVGKHDDALFAGFIALQMKKYFRGQRRYWSDNQTGL
jgi:hypothetical protein